MKFAEPPITVSNRKYADLIISILEPIPRYSLLTIKSVKKEMAIVENAVDNLSTVLKAQASIEAVKDNPEGLANEIAKWSPDIIMAVLKQHGTKLFAVSGYFVGAGIDLLNPELVERLMVYRLRVAIVNFHNKGWLSLEEYMSYINKLSKPNERAFVYQQLIIKKLENIDQQCC